jgi:NTP-dependent ternary system trypsin peptidase co-occuring protein
MIELATVVSQLRNELAQAQRDATGEYLRFELGPVELEVTVELSREGSVGGKVHFWVLEAGADGKAGTASTQRIKLTLFPRLAGSAAPPYIAGEAAERER